MFNKDEIKKLIFILSVVLFGCIIIKIIFSIEGILGGLSKIVFLVRPFVFGFVFAYLLLPLCNKIENNLSNNKTFGKYSSSIAILLSETFLIILIAVMVSLVIPQLLTSGQTLLNSLPRTLDNVYNWILKKTHSNTEFSKYFNNKINNLDIELNDYINNNILTNINNYVSNIYSGVKNTLIFFVNLIIGIVISIFILNDRKKFAKTSKKVVNAVFGDKVSKLIIDELQIADNIFSGFFIGKTIDSLIVGIVSFIFLFIMKMPYAAMIAIIIGVTNIIPIVGPFIGAIPSAIIIMGEAPDKCLIFIIFILILQQIDGHILGPKLIGNATGLSTFWVLFALTLFGGLMGITGMLVGVPLMAVIHDIFNKIIDYIIKAKEDKKAIIDEKDDIEK